MIELNDIQAKYSAAKHPDVIAGKRTADEVLREFLDTFDPNRDGKVTPEEFCEYYSNVSASIDDDDYFELMMRNAWHISGGVGAAANSSCRRVLVTHTDGRQTVEEIKNDIGIGATDKAAMMSNLQSQGITTAASIDLFGSADNTTDSSTAATTAPAAAAAPATPVKSNNGRPNTAAAGTPADKSFNANAAVANKNGRFGRGTGQTLSSSITF